LTVFSQMKSSFNDSLDSPFANKISFDSAFQRRRYRLVKLFPNFTVS